MRQNIYRLLSPPERGTPKHRVITAAKEICRWLILTLAVLIIARACGAFNPAPGSAGHHLITALILVFIAWFAIEPVVWLLKKIVGTGSKNGQDI